MVGDRHKVSIDHYYEIGNEGFNGVIDYKTSSEFVVVSACAVENCSKLTRNDVSSIECT